MTRARGPRLVRKNLKNWACGFDYKITKKLKLRTDFNEFYLATVQDALYNSSGTSALLNRKPASGHIGSEINTAAVTTVAVYSS